VLNATITPEKLLFAGRQRTTENSIDFGAGLTTIEFTAGLSVRHENLRKLMKPFEEVESGKAARLVFDIG
jgi:hypothetical protein